MSTLTSTYLLWDPCLRCLPIALRMPVRLRFIVAADQWLDTAGGIFMWCKCCHRLYRACVMLQSNFLPCTPPSIELSPALTPCHPTPAHPSGAELPLIQQARFEEGATWTPCEWHVLTNLILIGFLTYEVLHESRTQGHRRLAFRLSQQRTGVVHVSNPAWASLPSAKQDMKQ